MPLLCANLVTAILSLLHLRRTLILDHGSLERNHGLFGALQLNNVYRKESTWFRLRVSKEDLAEKLRVSVVVAASDHSICSVVLPKGYDGYVQMVAVCFAGNAR